MRRLAGQFQTFAEHLLNHAPAGWRPPPLTRSATVQTHCHQHAVTKDDADRELMRRAGIDARVLAAGAVVWPPTSASSKAMTTCP